MYENGNQQDRYTDLRSRDKRPSATDRYADLRTRSNRPTPEDWEAEARHREAMRREAKRRSSGSGRMNARRRKQATIERLILLGVLILVVVLVVVIISSCSAKSAKTAEAEQAQETIDGLSADHESLGDLEKDVAAMAKKSEEQDALTESDVDWPPELSSDVKATLLEKSRGNQDVRWVLEHSSSYNIAGDDIHCKLFKLMAKEDDATPFMLGFPSTYPNNTVNTCSETFTQGQVPFLYQWDPRWGYMEYSSAPFGTTGCGPTSFSMVAIAFTGNGTYSPGYIGQYCIDNGYMAETEGTYNCFFNEAAPEFGFQATEEEPRTEEEILSELKQGALIICHMGPGDFTEVGHYIVATGVNSDGTICVHDPYSRVNSEKSWAVGLLVEQASGFYVCTKEQ